MNSTTTSDLILEVKNLSVMFDIDHYSHTSSLRDSFVRMLKSPIDSLLQKRESLNVISGVNLKLNKGDRLGILGVNGAGKTTFCRCVAGMLMPSTGTIKTRGEVRSVFNALVGINPELTGRENAHLLALFLFPHEEDVTKIVDEALAFSELSSFIDTPFMNYSKGMQARLCLSIISAKSCELLILDEVFDGADEFFQKKIAERVLKMIHEAGAVMFVSHSPEQVKLACNRCIVISNSVIAFDGSVDDGIEYYHMLQKSL